MSARILVVDDLIPNIKLLEAKLNSEYYEVITAKSGIEALEILNNTSVDIILLDVMMPEMDGFETCKHIRNNPKTTHIPVIMVTALSETQDRINGLNAGADDFLTKPIDETALFARVRSLLRLKLMMDELRLRNQTSLALGDNMEPMDIDKNYTKESNILIIDDDNLQAKQLSEILIAKNANIAILSQPNKAIEILSGGNFDLIIISTQLLSVDSLRICSLIRSNENTRNIPILILVDEDEKDLLIKGLDIGINDYIITPIDSNEVLARTNTQIRRKKYQDALKDNYNKNVEMAVTDPLTGLHNRRYFDIHFSKLLQQSITDNKPIALMIVDIDHFKKINDQFGHDAGDEVLKIIPEIFNNNLRITDFAARFGGEEFAVILTNVNLNFAKIIAERIRESFEEQLISISTDPFQIKVTASIGLTLSTNLDTTETLFKKADTALYEAKNSGRNKVIMSA
jgi:two-component system, cell cycle response regulator